jgi:catechol 2,3-dioxygenase-like lactoylglutathione lyase family enzyme
MLSKVRHIGFRVPSIDEAVRFYSALGLQLIYKKTEDWSGVFGQLEVVKMKTADGDIIEFINDPFCQDHSEHICFTVDNIDEICSIIKANGGTIIVEKRLSPDQSVEIAFAQDPNRIMLELVTPK